MNATANDTPDNAAPPPAETPAVGPVDADRAPDKNRGGKGSRGARGGQSAGRRGPGQGQSQSKNPPPAGTAPARHHPLLDQLATLYPELFGETLRPLKRGIFEDLLAAHPEQLERDALKTALGLHARSTRYLTVVASGQPRHDLSGRPVEDLTPEQVHHALIEVFRRRGARSREDLRPKLRQRIAQAFEASGLSSEAYVERMTGRDEEVNQLTRDALDAAVRQNARDQALLRAFEASGKPLHEFADMYGLHVLEANRTLERARARQAKSQPAPADNCP